MTGSCLSARSRASRIFAAANITAAGAPGLRCPPPRCIAAMAALADAQRESDTPPLAPREAVPSPRGLRLGSRVVGSTGEGTSPCSLESQLATPLGARSGP